MNLEKIKSWLLENDSKKLTELWQKANEIRQKNVGNEVHLRGLLEISNYCSQKCGYCGINALNNNVERYRMTEAEIIECVHKALKFGYGTVVMQAGEDYGLTTEFITNIIKKIKQQTPLAVTLSLGERPYTDLQTWKQAGADRYLLRFETSDVNLYQKIHPSNKDRFVILKQLKELGYEIGSGVMIGIPGQTYDSLANDIDLFRKLDLDMIGVGPYIPHPNTSMGAEFGQTPAFAKAMAGTRRSAPTTIPATEEMTYKVVALTRIVCPQANIPSTTALATLNKMNGREIGLTRGANVVMPNITPPEYRIKYEIYPNKACANETAEQCQTCLASRIAAIGRTIGTGHGNRSRLPLSK